MRPMVASALRSAASARVLVPLLCALALAGGGLALAGPRDLPRARLEAAGKSTSNAFVSGIWRAQTRHGCSVAIVDPPPGKPRALKIPAGRHRMAVVLRKRVRPQRVAVRVARPAGRSRNKPIRLVRRRNDAGRTVAWEARFRAKLRKRLDIFTTAAWAHGEGCGGGRMTWHFRVRS